MINVMGHQKSVIISHSSVLITHQLSKISLFTAVRFIIIGVVQRHWPTHCTDVARDHNARDQPYGI